MDSGTHASITKVYSLLAILRGSSPFSTSMDNSSSEASRKSVYFTMRLSICFPMLSSSVVAASSSRAIAVRAADGDPVMPSGMTISEKPCSARMLWTLSRASFLAKTAMTLPSFLSKEENTSTSALTRSVEGSSATVPTMEKMLLYPEYNSRSIGSLERISRFLLVALSSVIL